MKKNKGRSLGGYRSPHTLSQLTREHILAAVEHWDSRLKVSNFKMKTPYCLSVEGRKLPTKAIVALAHELAGLGILNDQLLSGNAARDCLHTLNFETAKDGTIPPTPRQSAVFRAINQLERFHIEAAAATIQEDMAFATAQKYVAEKLHETEWRISIDGLWFSPRAIRAYAFFAAKLQYTPELSSAEYAHYLARIRELGFLVNRGRPPVRISEAARKPNAIRLAADGLVGVAVDAPVNSPAGNGDDSLRIVLDGIAYSASALLRLAPDASITNKDRLKIAAAGGLLQAAPDPVDDELADLLSNEILSTEARRLIISRIGQGKFRKALMRLGGSCRITGVALHQVLRAAHIHRWADCSDTPNARLDPENGLLLTANMDCLFEIGLIAFDDDGAILISDRLSSTDSLALGVHDGMRLAGSVSSARRAYLAKHRYRTRAMRAVALE